VYSVNIGNGLAGVLSKKENNQYMNDTYQSDKAVLQTIIVNLQPINAI